MRLEQLQDKKSNETAQKKDESAIKWYKTNSLYSG